MEVVEIMRGVWECSSPPMEKEDWNERQKRQKEEWETWKENFKNE